MSEINELAATIDNIYEQSHFDTATRLAFNLAAKSNDPEAVAQVNAAYLAELGDALYDHVSVIALDLMTIRILGPILAKLDTNELQIRNALTEIANQYNCDQPPPNPSTSTG